jgi:hypothetical protein
MTKKLQLIADDVAGQFLSGLDSLQNLTREAAESQSLSPSEIERVAQLVNKETQIRMYAERGPKGGFEFDMVDPSDIISSFNTEFDDPVTIKSAKGPYEHIVKFADKEEEYSGNNQFSGNFLLETKAKLELDIESIEDDISKTAGDIENGYNKVYNIMKQAVVGEEATIHEIISFVDQNDPTLTKIAAHIARDCMGDIAPQIPFPESTIIHSDPIPVDRFEGSKSMVKELNTLIHQHDKMEAQNRGYVQLRESVRYAVEGINTHLRGTMDVD